MCEVNKERELKGFHLAYWFQQTGG